MKLVDIYWYRDFENMSEEEQAQKIREGLNAELEAARALASQARIEHERAVKLRDIKKALYGKIHDKLRSLHIVTLRKTTF